MPTIRILLRRPRKNRPVNFGVSGSGYGLQAQHPILDQGAYSLQLVARAVCLNGGEGGGGGSHGQDFSQDVSPPLDVFLDFVTVYYKVRVVNLYIDKVLMSFPGVAPMFQAWVARRAAGNLAWFRGHLERALSSDGRS